MNIIDDYTACSNLFLNAFTLAIFIATFGLAWALFGPLLQETHAIIKRQVAAIKERQKVEDLARQLYEAGFKRGRTLYPGALDDLEERDAEFEEIKAQLLKTGKP